MSGLLVLILIGVGVYALIKFAKKGQTKTKAYTCPRCQTVNTFDAQPCGNCGSTRTWREYQFSSESTPFIQKCPDCKQTTVIPAKCKNCDTDMTGIVQGGKGRAALLGAARGANSGR